ncbi:hypothetical protein HZA45_01235 [Candidatus Peregrinibacteria bacterium]|nr:hypothetical protein [Candidatus Peregrinibacteria bacterium]
MKKKHLKQAIISSLAFCGVIIAGIILWFVYPVTQIRAEDLLPADKTILFLDLPQPEALPKLAAWFPVLQEIPSPLPRSAALVTPGNGRSEWIFFDAAFPGTAPRAHAQSEEALKLLGSGARLSAAADFRNVLSENAAHTRLFLTAPSPLLPHPVILGPLIVPRAALSVEQTASGVTLSTFVSDASPHRALSPVLPLAFEHPTLVLAGSEALKQTGALAAAFPDAITTPVRGALEQAIADTFGPDISMTYDIIPLLEHTSIFETGTDPAMDRSLFVLTGSVPDQAKNTTLMEKLRSAFTRTLPVSEAVHRTFEKGQTFDDIRANPDALEERTENVNGWDVQTIRSPQANREFTTAHLAGRSVIGSSRTAVLAMLDGTGAVLRLPYARAGTIVAGGLADMDTLHNLLQFFLPSPVTLPRTEGTYRWSVVEEGRVVRVLVAR